MRACRKRPFGLARCGFPALILAALGCTDEARDASELPVVRIAAARLVAFTPVACPSDPRAAAQHAASLAALAMAHWDRVAFDPREAGISIGLSRQAVHCYGAADSMAQRDAEVAVLASREAALWRMVQDARRRLLRAHDEQRLIDMLVDGQRLLDLLEPQNLHVAELRRRASAWLRAAQGRTLNGKDKG
jgi:hypothetical protein